MNAVVKSFEVAAAVIGVTLAFAQSAQAQQYCHNEWTAAKGDHQVCEFSPDPRYATKCHWEWNAREGDHQVCQQSN